MKSVESKEDPLMEIVRTCQNNTNSILFQIVNNFKTYFQNKTKQIKNVLSQYNKKEMGRMKN